MGYRSDVKIKMGLDAYKLLENSIESSEIECARDMIATANDLQIKENYVTIYWQYVKWYESYSDVKAVLDVLKELDKIVEDKPELLDTYYYKLIEIGEDNATSESTNDYDQYFTDDFYVICDFSL